ncbi:protein of unknown function [Mucilaginibacter pineti]|uniref:DUF4397 domain-containing protein n=1 Tax=Mucilaginibacter pineti TaxID=1391627 RepID=A0A1G6W4R4_9SPHI|nr:DUF4397 domain-containing protein [Mucilaginibacter pineti]SDD60703.1 protein of unknown function [Mucilaginibacter pineti]
MNISIRVLFFVALSVAVISSCKKNDDKPVDQLTTSVNFVNASNNTINFYLNGTRITNSSSYFPGGTLGYTQVTAGTQNYQVKIAGSTVPLFTKAFPFDTAKVYSLYVAGQTADDTFFTTDTLVADTADFAKLRFVNASPSAGKLMLAFAGTGVADVVMFDTVSYKRTTKFIRVKSGDVPIVIYRQGFPGQPLRDTITLAANGIYTIFGYGTVTLIGNQGLADGLIVNK